MKEDIDFTKLSQEEKLKVENELLMLKLETEFGMTDLGLTSSEKINNDWLNYVYSYEKQFAENKQIKVYDFIERPAFKKIDEIESELVSLELNRLTEIMKTFNVRLETICDYSDEEIYRFITEELFEVETDDIRLPGLRHGFIYEEFHPNHDYDIRKLSEDFIGNLITKIWDDDQNIMLLCDFINLDNKVIDRDRFVSGIQLFQQKYQKMKLLAFTIQSVDFNLEKGTGLLNGTIKYKSAVAENPFAGPVIFKFNMDEEFWGISGVMMPGLMIA
jgi:hypothetical protein